MPNQMVQMTAPQRLAALLQSTDQNQVMPQQPMPNMGGGLMGTMDPMKMMQMKQYMDKLKGPSAETPGVPGVPNLPVGGY